MRSLTTLFLILVCTVNGFSQYVVRGYYHPYRYPYYGWNYGYGYGYTYPARSYAGDVLSGAAEYVDARGNFRVNFQASERIREETFARALDNRKKMVDLKLYEISKMPTPEQKRQMVLIENERRMENEFRQSVSDPPLASITSGLALNGLMPTLRDMSYSSYGSEVPIRGDLLKNINVQVTSGNAAILRRVNHLNWPLSLRGDRQQQIDQLLAQAVENCKVDHHDRVLMSSLRQEVKGLKSGLRGGVENREIDFREFCDASDFLQEVEDGLQVLSKPDAGRHFDGTYEARGSSVLELVQHMSMNGLRFAPAQPGQEAAYIALHNQLVRYAKSSVASGFRLRLAAAPQAQTAP